MEEIKSCFFPLVSYEPDNIWSIPQDLLARPKTENVSVTGPQLRPIAPFHSAVHALRLILHAGTRAKVEINVIFMLRPASAFELV